MQTILRGARFRPMDSQVCLLQQTAGSPLRLEPEPDNKFDPNAIKVMAWDAEEIEHFIGYIAKEDCEDALSIINSGHPFQAAIGEENGLQPSIIIEHVFPEDGDEFPASSE